MTTFEQLSGRQQVNRLRTLAFEALKAYPFEVRKLTLLNHGFNTVFRVDTTGGQKYALRINVNSKRTLENVRAEVAWLHALHQDTDLPVVVPVPTESGDFMQLLPSPFGADPLPSVLFEWMPGPLLEDRVTVDLLRKLGTIAARLHQHAAHWTLPEGCALPLFDTVFLSESRALLEPQALEFMTAEQQALFAHATEIAQQTVDGLHQQTAQLIPLHTDLHDSNLKVWRNELLVFDFDDAAIGHPAQDIANSLYYFHVYDEGDAYRAAFKEGYTSVLPWPFEDESVLETLLAARGLLLANDVLTNLNPDVRELIPGFVEKTTRRMTNWLQHGKYRTELEPVLS